MTKAQEKVEKQATEKLTMLFNHVLKDFKNIYFESYHKYRMQLQIAEVRSAERELERVKNAMGSTDRRWGVIDNETIDYVKNMIEGAKSIIQNKFTLDHEILTEGNEAYNKSIDKVVNKLVNAGMSTYCSVKEVGIMNNGELSFLIADGSQECHARMIFACGEINAPHYRFITTIRQK